MNETQNTIASALFANAVYFLAFFGASLLCGAQPLYAGVGSIIASGALTGWFFVRNAS